MTGNNDSRSAPAPIEIRGLPHRTWRNVSMVADVINDCTSWNPLDTAAAAAAAWESNLDGGIQGDGRGSPMTFRTKKCLNNRLSDSERLRAERLIQIPAAENC